MCVWLVYLPACWRDGRVAEGAPLLREYGGNSIEGSNPSLSANFKKAPVAQLDRVPGYEPGGREFESLRARQIRALKQGVTKPPVFHPSYHVSFL